MKNLAIALEMATSMKSNIEASVDKAATREEHIRLVGLAMEADRLITLLRELHEN